MYKGEEEEGEEEEDKGRSVDDIETFHAHLSNLSECSREESEGLFAKVFALTDVNLPQILGFRFHHHVDDVIDGVSRLSCLLFVCGQISFL